MRLPIASFFAGALDGVAPVDDEDVELESVLDIAAALC
jgi:hypothetical protein